MANNETIGARLKSVRLERGLSVEDAHRATKIHLEVIKAIEDDDYININPVYLKGFLKIYCQFLGVELPDSVAQKKHTQVHAKVGEDAPARPRPIQARPQHPAPARQRPRPAFDLSRIIAPAAIAAAAVVACLLLFWAGRFVVSKIASAQKNRHVQAVRMRKEKIARKPAPAKTADTKGRIDPGENLRLGVRALDDCWLQLKADNKVVFQNILKKGRFESWEARDRMDIVLGSAGGVQFELNGKIIPSLGKRGQVLKDIVITRNEGLKVGK